MSHNFTTVTLPCLRWLVTAEARVRAQILPFGIVKLQNWHFAWFSLCTFCFPVSIITLVLHTYTMTTVDAT